jgi:hypothetical protein
MAELLQRAHNLTVIRVEHRYGGDGPVVTVAAVRNVDGERRPYGSIDVAASEFGFPLSDQRPLVVPPAVTAMLRDVRQKSGWDWPNAVREIWLHLVKPYASLGAVPWERYLVDALGMPIVRLPDVLPLPASRTGMARIALVTDDDPASLALVPGVVSTVEASGHAVVSLIAVPHAAEQALQKAFADVGRTGPQVLAVTGGGFSLAAIADALRGSVFDGVHFSIGGVTVGSEGALLVRASDFGHASEIITASQVREFLVRLGASTAIFTAPPSNPSDAGLRLLVDAVGADHSGAVALLGLDGGAPPDGWWTSLRNIYWAVFDPTADALETDPNLTAFLQPSHLERAHRESEEVSLKQLEIDPSLVQLLEGGPLGAFVETPYATTRSVFEDGAILHFEGPSAAITPAWAWTARRYLESARADLLRFEQDAATREPSALEWARHRGAQRAVDEATQIIAATPGGLP